MPELQRAGCPSSWLWHIAYGSRYECIAKNSPALTRAMRRAQLVSWLLMWQACAHLHNPLTLLSPA